MINFSDIDINDFINVSFQKIKNQREVSFVLETLSNIPISYKPYYNMSACVTKVIRKIQPVDAKPINTEMNK